MPPCDRARTKLINWSCDAQSGSGQDAFISRNVLLHRLFTRVDVHTILKCHEGNCKDCKRDYNFICSGKGMRIKPGDEINRIFPPEPQINDMTASAIQLFALLVRIGHPLLIIPLLEHGRNDSNILDSYCEGSFHLSKIREKYWNECHRKPDPTGKSDPTNEFSQKVARLLEESFHIFFRPIFRDEKFHVLPDSVKLPFFNEEAIGQGSFGKVFAFQIFEGHNKFSKFGNIHHFARKVISRNAERDFLPGYQEGHNLSLVNTLENPHIVQVVTSFTYKDEFNIVFPRSLTNLDKALRDPQYRLGQIVPPLRSCPIWLQMMGLAKALRDFSNGSWVDSRKSNTSEHLSVRDARRSTGMASRNVATHFDLKPSNILVNRPSRNPPTFHFIITDFGLAYIKDANSGSSGTRGRGGDDAYAPPEYLEERQSRKYDVWSLGCIFLELLTFLVMGYEGVISLDEARRKPSTRGARQTICFWEQVASSPPLLKEEVERFVLTVQKRAELLGQYSPEEQLLIKNTIVMIMKMLSTQPETRLSANDVVWYLENIGRGQELRGERSGRSSQDEREAQFDHSPRPPANDGAIPQQIVSEPRWQPVRPQEESIRFAEGTDTETEVEPGRLRNLRGLFIRSNVDRSEEDSQAVLQVFTEDQSLRFVITSLNLLGQEPREQHCLRQHVHIMPQYAFRKIHNPRRADAGIRLVWSSNLRRSIMRYDFSGQLNDLRKVHGALLGQDIYHTIEVDDVEIVTSTSLFRRNPKFDVTNEEQGPFTVQLWRENGPEVPNEKRRNVRTCRLLIYFSTKVYVIPFHQLFRFPRHEVVMEQALVTLESGAVGNTRQSFEMTVLKAENPPEVLPTFPLDTVELENKLSNRPETFKSIRITFRAHEDLYLFWNDYRVLKEDWLDEMGVKRKVSSNSAPFLTLDFT